MKATLRVGGGGRLAATVELGYPRITRGDRWFCALGSGEAGVRFSISVALWFGLGPSSAFAGAGQDFREGMGLLKSGKEFAAAMLFISALDDNPRHKGALKELTEVAKTAYEEQLEVAEREEKRGRHEQTVEEYKRLLAFVDSAREIGVINFDTIDVYSKLNESMQATAAEAYSSATTSRQGGDWAAAIDGYRKALSYVANYEDAEKAIGESYYEWATNALERRAYRDSVKLYAQAWKSGHAGDAQQRAASIQSAIAGHLVDGGHCRLAVKEYRLAQQIFGHPEIAEGLAAARACAVTPIAMPSVENPTGVNPAGMAVSDLLADGIMASVRRNASEFLQVVERGSLDAILREQGLSGISSTSTPSGVSGVRYLVLGKVTQISSDVGQPVVRSAAEQAEVRFTCTETGYDGRPYETTCSRQVTVNFEEHSQKASVKMAMSLRVVDVASGTQIATESFTATAEDTIRYGSGFRLIDGTPVAVADTTSNGVFQFTDGQGVISTNLSALKNGRTTLATEDQLAQTVMEDIVGRAATSILGATDTAGKAPDPASLDIHWLQ